jgi:hypothetical protein
VFDVRVGGCVPFLLFGQPRPLKIGSLKNGATKTTQLVGKVVSGSAFAVNNPSGGPALGLQVNAGQAPLTVNAEAGKATNLDADKLGGKDSTDFYAAGSKVADADTVDGKDSTDFLASGCRSDFTTFAEGRPCVSQLMGDNTFYGGTFSNGAVSTCTDMGARIGNSNDVMLTFTDPTFNYFAGFESGWLADRFGNDVWGTWNVSNPPADGNFDGGPEHAQFVQLSYRCVY